MLSLTNTSKQYIYMLLIAHISILNFYIYNTIQNLLDSNTRAQ